MKFLTLLLFVSPLLAQSYDPKRGEDVKVVDQEGFRKQVGQATLALYQGKQVCGYKQEDFGFFGMQPVWECEFKNKFVCTATVVDQMDERDYAAITAGHCIDVEKEDEYFIGDTVEDKPVLKHATIVKYESDDRYDYALISFKSFKPYPVIDINEDKDDIPDLGTDVLNVNFSLGIGKEYLTGKVVSEKLYGDGLKNRFLVSVGVGPGASGSAIVDVNRQKIVGLVEMIARGTQMPAIIIPTGRNLADFIDDDSAGVKPLPADESQLPKQPAPPPPVKLGFFGKIWAIIKYIYQFYRDI